MEPLKRILFPISILAAVLLAFLYFRREPTTPCCESVAACDLAAPSGLSSVLQGDSLKLNWEQVDGAVSYLVDVYDVTENSTPIFKNQKSLGTSLTLASDTFEVTHLYKTVVSSICKDCIPSTLFSSSETCPIIIEDLIVMMPVCRGASCTCTGTLVAIAPPVGGSQSFEATTASMTLHKVTVSCTGPNPKSEWFVIQTVMDGSGIVRVTVPSHAYLSSGGSCPGGETYDEPSKPTGGGCGFMSSKDIDYDLTISKNAAGDKVRFAFTNLPSGCSVSVTKCNGCQ